MHPDIQKYEFASQTAEGVSINSINNNLCVTFGILFSWTEDKFGDMCDMRITAYESLTDFLKETTAKSLKSLIITLHNNVIVLSYFWVFYFTKLLFYQFQKFFYMTFLLCSFYPVDYD